MHRNSEGTARLRDERRARGEGRRLYAFLRRLSRPFDQTTYAWMLATIAKQVGGRTGSLALYRDAEQELAIVATLGYPLAIVEDLGIAPGEGVIGTVFKTGRAVVQARERAQRRLRYETDAFLAVPLLAAEGHAVGVMALADRQDGDLFTHSDLLVARMWAAPAALAIGRERVSAALAELTRDAIVDPVTGLFNRRHFENRLEGEIQRGRRQHQDLALLMVDIDDFKRINDTFGHPEGDRALRGVADMLRGSVRIFDVCARYGGEEFGILMPGASAAMALQIAERIRRVIQDRSGVDPRAGTLTVSIGVGVLGPGETAEDLVGSADRALIAAKRAGKNAVKIHGPRDVEPGW
jgi:diguanylate cyclase (GGDEF)-like protein